MNAAELLTKSVHSPFVVQKINTARGEDPSLRMDGLHGVDREDGVSKVSFNFLYTFGYIDHAYVSLYI